jgi:pyruvate dehydrogenase E2 component (dihydrolipoamide acetyltransferase)
MPDAGAAATREFSMPSLGADMEAGTILKWRVAPGDRVARGDIVVEVETEKAEMEVEIFDDGVVERLIAAIGEKIPVGGPLALIRSESKAPLREAAPPAAAPPARPTPPPRAPAPPAPPSRAAAPPVPPASPPAPERAAAGAERVHATPLARRIAGELGVELAGIAGSGPGGAITADDVRAAAGTIPAPAPKPAPALVREREPAERGAARQRVIAALMERSKREIPHYYLSASLDLTPALAWLEARNRARPVSERVLPAALLLRAVALALPAAPELSGHYEGGEFRAAPTLHLGVAIALRGGGLIAPAVLEAGAKSLDELMRALRELGERARTGKLRASEMSSATLTVTSLGDGAVDSVQAVIYPPQVAIVGFGTPAPRAWVDREGGLCVRTIVQATLAADHRVSNGHRGALFLKALERALLDPERLA